VSFILCFYLNTAFAIEDCGSNIPKNIRLEQLSNGTGYTEYEKEIGEAFHKDKVLFEKLFKIHVAKYSNISGSIVNFKDSPKKIYRSAILSENLALLSILVKEKNVKSIVVLTNSKIFDIAPMINKEREFFSVLGGKQFNHVLNFHCDFDFNDKKEVKEVQGKIVSIIKLIQNSEGNVLIHCLGGEHRSEVVFEIMQRCFNKLDMDNITQRYKCHTGWKSESLIGNFRKENLEFIRDFPCDLL
tara:strand:- start:4633 stop:5361 length:729 start_codon:yes stop_codon:yes gene_type:complete